MLQIDQEEINFEAGFLLRIKSVNILQYLYVYKRAVYLRKRAVYFWKRALHLRKECYFSTKWGCRFDILSCMFRVYFVYSRWVKTGFIAGLANRVSRCKLQKGSTYPVCRI